VAQQGPPPRRSSRPPASSWQDQPGDPGWQDQPSAPPAWQDPQTQPPVPSWQDQQAPWPDQAPARHGQHSAPAPGWPGQAAPPASARHSQPTGPMPGWPDPAAPPPTARHSQPPAWQDQPLRGRPATYNPDDPDDDLDEDMPPWAGLSVTPRRPRGSRGSEPQQDGPGAYPAEPAPRGLTRRAIATRARKARRKLLIGGGSAIAVVILAAGGWALFGPKAPVKHTGDFVNTFQAGELRKVPSSCQVISGPVLSQYLPGQPTRVASAALNGASESQCTWTLDAKPVYRVLEVTSQAFAPSGLNSGDGSATFGAIDNFGAAQQALTHPVKHSHLPAASITSVPGLGAQAFSALQVIKGGGNTTDLVTLVVRDRNVLVTVALQGLDKSAKGHYGPVDIGTLRAGTVAAAREVLAGLK
jgi:hypothetical protein